MIFNYTLTNTDKFFVYIIKNDLNSLARIFTDINHITTILNNRQETGVISIIRPGTNQYAVLLGGDTAVWMDCPDATLE